MFCYLALSLTILSPQQDPESKPTPWVRPITLQAGKIPYRSLAHPLLPPTMDLVNGNAALCYYRAFSPEVYSYTRNQKDWWKTEEKWSSSKLEDLKPEEMTFLLKYWPLEQVELGARRTYCDWELNDRLKLEGFSALLPDVQGLRELARLMSYRIRLKFTKKDYEGALKDIQTLMAMGRHVSEGPTLITSLVGIAITSIALERLEEGMQLPGFPSVHWDLTYLPVPFVNLESALGGEQLGVFALLPNLPMDRVIGKEEATRMLTNFQKQLGQIAGGSEAEMAAGLMALSFVSYTQSKEWLIQQGVSRELVETMPVAQAVMLRTLGEFSKERDDLFRYANLPLWVSAPLLREQEKSLAPSTNQSLGKILSRLLLPALRSVFEARVRLDRKIAALRQLEAIRLYATQKGELPASLEDTKLPQPIDPWHGKPFQYTRKGPTEAVLEGPPLGNGPKGVHNTISYQITWKK